jgi:hypothetical protein
VLESFIELMEAGLRDGPWEDRLDWYTAWERTEGLHYLLYESFYQVRGGEDDHRSGVSIGFTIGVSWLRIIAGIRGGATKTGSSVP